MPTASEPPLPTRLISAVDEAFAFFQAFAEGSYAQSSQWDATMSAELLPRLRSGFDRLLFELDGDSVAADAHLRDFYELVGQLNAQGEHPVVEVEEMADLWEILEQAFAIAGLDAAEVAALTTWEQYLLEDEDEA